MVDGNGESEVVAVFVFVNEDGDTMSKLVEIFKKHNPSWKNTKTIMTDKDFMERSVYKQEFQCAELQLCLFHVLRSIKREIITEKMNIRLEQKEHCLEIIQKIAYSPNEEEYAKNLENLKSTGVEPVIDYMYFCSSWDSIKKEWVIGLKTSCHYNNHTTNRLESINQKLKQVISKFSNLKKFFEDLEIILSCLRQERDGRIASVLMKRSQYGFEQNSPEARFLDFVTPFAFKIIQSQLALSRKVTIPELGGYSHISIKTSSGEVKTETTSCTCLFTVTNELPCHHTFASFQAPPRCIL